MPQKKKTEWGPGVLLETGRLYILAGIAKMHIGSPARRLENRIETKDWAFAERTHAKWPENKFGNNFARRRSAGL